MKIYVTNLKKLQVINFGFLLNNPELAKGTVSNLVSFASTRLHKIAFSALVAMKSNYQNRIDRDRISGRRWTIYDFKYKIRIGKIISNVQVSRYTCHFIMIEKNVLFVCVFFLILRILLISDRLHFNLY